MVDILTHLHQYVPQVEYQEQNTIPDSTDSVLVCKAKTHKIMFGGDQLTVVRARAAVNIKYNSMQPTRSLKEFTLTIEDWHVNKICLK